MIHRDSDETGVSHHVNQDFQPHRHRETLSAPTTPGRILCSGTGRGCTLLDRMARRAAHMTSSFWVRRYFTHPAAGVACAPGRLRVLQELGNRSGQLGVTHRRDWRSQCAAPEPADDLLVLAVVPPGHELSNASQQRGNRQSNLLCTAWRLAPIAARRFLRTKNPASIRRYRRGFACFHLSQGSCTWRANGGALVSFL
jgi:hypothetical protein